LFTVVGRSDIGAVGCTASVLPPIDFETPYRNGNLSFRIPLQLFGLGLIDAIQDLTILNSSAATASLRTALGISGIPNRSGKMEPSLALDGRPEQIGRDVRGRSLQR
jgi:hypothetical protein